MSNIMQRNIGVSFNEDGSARIRVWAPMATRVEIKTANGLIPLQKSEFGYWSAYNANLKAGEEYQVVLNGEKILPDPAALFQPHGVMQASEAVDVNLFKWTDGNWKNIPLQHYIFYELHTGTFTPHGTLSAIEHKLDYLKELGVTAIELMPLAQFPGKRNWGYDGVMPFAVQNTYGGPQALHQLVNACHQRGLAVVMDVVYNHLGPEGSCLHEFGPYFTGKYVTPWGQAINFDDEWCTGVREYFIENALMWFRDFHIDALRLDAVHAIRDFSATHILQEIQEYTRHLENITGRPYYLIVESDLNDPRFIQPAAQGGYGMDAQWADDFHHALRTAATTENTGYYKDFKGIPDLAKAYRHTYVYNGQWSEFRHRFFGKDVSAYPGRQFVVFSQNHDQVGNRMLGERTSMLLSPEMQKVLAASVILSPFLPLLFMGEEWGEPHPFQYFADVSNSELAAAIRNGRKKEFAAFNWQGEAPDPLDEKTYLDCKLQWDIQGQPQHAALLAFYRRLIQIRKAAIEIIDADRNNIKAVDDEQAGTLLLHRWNDTDEMVCALNFSGSTRRVVLPKGQNPFQLILHSGLTRQAAPVQEINGSDEVTLPPHCAMVFFNASFIHKSGLVHAGI